MSTGSSEPGELVPVIPSVLPDGFGAGRLPVRWHGQNDVSAAGRVRVPHPTLATVRGLRVWRHWHEEWAHMKSAGSGLPSPGQ